MSSFLRSGSSGRRFVGSRLRLITAVAALAVGGCSADIARFDFPASANFNDPQTGAIAPNERSALGADPVASPPPAAEAYDPPPAEKSIEVATLPDRHERVKRVEPAVECQGEQEALIGTEPRAG